uniref:Uncharacterized protein MANES_18G101600 n=1 Tax=Rhizophora mucronata TaxID=61149 RepID=A0A2P2MB96_RHIMU
MHSNKNLAAIFESRNPQNQSYEVQEQPSNDKQDLEVVPCIPRRQRALQMEQSVGQAPLVTAHC